MLNNTASQRIVDLLFLWAWKGTENDLWKNIDGFDKRKTPLSDHLLSLMSEWSKSFAGLSPDFELMFERFEALGSLAHLECNEETGLEKSAANAGHDPLTWMPIGRIGWHNSNLERLLQELQSTELRAALAQAGFARRSPRFLELFAENLKRFARRMRW